MTDIPIHHFESRTDAKLKYAQIHLDELREKEPLGGDDFDRAHQESFLFHLFGAKDAFLLELNAYYDCNLEITHLTAGKLKDALIRQSKTSPELLEIYNLEKDNNSWLSHAKEMRDYSTHVWWLRRAYHLGGENDRQVWLDNPATGQQIKRHFIDEFANWVNYMRELLDRLRRSAKQRNLPE